MDRISANLNQGLYSSNCWHKNRNAFLWCRL